MSAEAASLRENCTDSWTQNGQILKHLQAGKPLTPLTALYQFGCNRLAARICDIRADGYEINRTMIKLPSGKRVAEYRMPMKDLGQCDL